MGKAARKKSSGLRDEVGSFYPYFWSISTVPLLWK
jgi:hypothetical protein